MSDSQPTDNFIRSVERPAAIIETALRMILGGALVITLIVKIYLQVLTDHVCELDVATLGNSIRCAATFDIVGGFLAMAAGVSVAGAFFTRRFDSLSVALTTGAAAVVFSLFGLFLEGDYNWRLSIAVAVILLLAVALPHIEGYFRKR